MSKVLHSEIENFLAEVDAIASEDKVKVPKTNWIVQVDPKTNFPFYHNFVTKETTWELPTEYQKYLDEYKVYLQNRKSDPLLPVKSSKADGALINLPDSNDRKRRCIKRAWLHNNVEQDIRDLKKEIHKSGVEFVSEYVGYSESSPSEDSDLSREHSPKSAMAEVALEPSGNSTTFFGPHLPPDLAIQCKEGDPSHIGSDLLESSRMIFQKFGLLDPQQDKLTPQQIAYIQFLTRYEDWKDGHLSDEYFKKVVEEVSIYMESYEKECVPRGRTLEWDSGGGRFVFKSLEDGLRRLKRTLNNSLDFPTGTDSNHTPTEENEMASDEISGPTIDQSARAQRDPPLENEQPSENKNQPTNS